MHPSSSSPFTFLLLALFALQVTASVLAKPQLANRNFIAARQEEDLQVSCEEYGRLVNLSTIGTNSTFRSAFIQASPDGTRHSGNILDEATAKYTELALINDTKLNDNKTGCGNLTELAIAEAPANFTKGIVGPFSISAAARLGGGLGGSAVLTAALVGTALWLL